MKITISKYFSMEFSEPNELLELIEDEDKIHFLQSLSCNESVLKHVADQIMYGCTEDGYHASIGEVKSKPNTSLQNAVRLMSKNFSEIANSQITELELKLKELEKSNNEWRCKYYDLYHGVSR
tara:strand:+ start:541 stop:909 length:369 start_codon:yes stop_codon:yes gene_type:complete